MKNIITITDIEGFESITLGNYPNPRMTLEYVENSPLVQAPNFGASTISYKKIDNSTIISYQKKLTEKSGFDMNIRVEQDQTIPEGYIDFYTIKKSTTKSNGFYRLEFNNRLFKLFAITSRKYSFKQPISSYQVDSEITPGRLSAVIARMINIIEKYAKTHNKQRIIQKLSSFQTPENLLYLELCALDKLKDYVDSNNFSKEEKKGIEDFILKYEKTRTNQRLVRAKK